MSSGTNPSPAVAALPAAIADRSARVGIVGMGYVGLPLALLFSESGFTVLGFDTDPAKVDMLAAGRSYIKHIGPERVAACAASGRFSATTDFDRLAECDCLLICVPTPLGRHREPDLSFVLSTTREIARRLRPGQLVVLESTTYPGTTDEELQPLLSVGGLETPRDYLLAFSPEREDPGNRSFNTKTIPKVVGGVNSESTAAACALYRAALDQVVPVASSRVAEAAKLLENIYRAINIALVNELKMTFDAMGINVWEVIEAAKTKPFGFQAFYPGPGLGGHCIPLDPFYLSWKASEHGMWTRFIDLAGEINTRMPAYVLNKTLEALNQDGKSIRGARVLVLGLSYKDDIDDDRESPSYEIIELLREHGAQVAYCDPYFPEARAGRKHDVQLSSVPCTAAEFAAHDCLVLATAHSEFSNPALYGGVRLVVDTRNVVGPDWGPRVVRG
ncbi:MAG: nucleotide sugar dehydrogenase [Gaiellales bacterium]|nr:nucleotide sugar dehydrogenase [Gaiellales bacterium]